MGMFGSAPFGTLPLSGADATADDTIPVQATVFEHAGHYGDPDLEAYDSSDAQLGMPMADAVATDDTIFTFTGFFDLITDDDADGYQPDWAQGPPAGQFDETGQTTGSISNNDWVDEDEPVTDGHFSSPLFFEENVPFQPVLDQAYDDDEPLVDSLTSGPLVDAPAGSVDDVGPQELGQVYDEDEPVTDGCIQVVQPDQFDETGQTPGTASNNECIDEDEPVTGGITSSPQEDSQTLDGTITGTSNNDFLDEDEPVTDGVTLSPQDDQQVIDATITGTSNNDWLDEDEPVTDGFQNSPLDASISSTTVSVSGLVITTAIGCYHISAWQTIADSSTSWVELVDVASTWSTIPDPASAWTAVSGPSTSWNNISNVSTTWTEDC